MRILALCGLLMLVGCGGAPSPVVTPTPTPTLTVTPTSPVTESPATPLVSPTPSPLASANPSVKKEVETRLGSDFSQSTGVTLTSLNCPEAIAAKVGSQFDCAAVADGQSFAIAVELTDATGSQFTWRTQKVVFLGKLEEFIQNQMKSKNTTVTAKCDGKVRIAKPGDTFECQVTTPQGQSRPAKVTVKNEQGEVDVNL